MKTKILTLIIALISINFCNAQEIQMEKLLGGYKYTQNGKQMKMGDLVKTMESNPQAFELIKKAQSDNVLASAIGFVGGGLIGWPIGTSLGGGDPNWTLAGIGAGLVVIGIPISSSVNKNTKKAVDLYNSSLNSSSFYYEFKPEFKLITSGNGVGLIMSF